MSVLLSKCNNVVRNEKRIIEEDCIIRKREKLLHVCFNSQGCRFRKSGSCTMCNYGQGHMISENRMKEILCRIESEAAGVDSILIGTLGSIFDTVEISRKCLELVCDELNKLSVYTVIFETHYTMIDEEICRWLKEKMPHKDIVIEVGLESADEFVQNECLNKKIQLDNLRKKIQLLHSLHMSVTVNVFLGAPFLTAREQIEDTYKTILWALDNGADSIVIFPANIRKDTLLEYLYKHNQYTRINQWYVIEVLRKVPMHYLKRIYFAWYGDWVDKNITGDIENLPPYACAECQDKWMKFYHEFLSSHSPEERKSLLDNMVCEMGKCECSTELKNNINLAETKSRLERIKEANSWLQNNMCI